jgi:hypothetical protein
MFTNAMILIIVAATNAYAEHTRNDVEFTSFARDWHPTTVNEICKYIGYLLYMGMHIEKRVEMY